MFNQEKKHFCTVVSPLKKLKAHTIIKIQLLDFVRVMYWYLWTLWQKDFSVNENVLILCVGDVNYAFCTRGLLQKYPPPKKKKIDFKFKSKILLTNCRSCLSFFLISKRIIVIRVIVFDELQFFKWLFGGHLGSFPW